MEKKEKNILSLIAGAAIGAGLTYLFTTKKGQEIRGKAKKTATDISNAAKDLYNDITSVKKEV